MSKDKYDRQTRLWGEGQILISASKLLCLNSDSLSSEILKNLILSGVGEVTIIDNAKILLIVYVMKKVWYILIALYA